MSRRLWGLFAAVWMYAAAAQELSEALFLAELPQVLTASRIATAPHEAPAPVTVLDRATIRATGLTELHDLLRLVPGFLVADWPGGSPVVVNRGLGDAHPNRLLVLLDGHSVVNPATGAVDWHDLPLRVEDIERIEVVRGPNQASYGAGAFQGVVQIFTRDQAEDTGIGLTLARGRFGFADTYARAGHSGGQVAWRLSLSQRQALNFRDRQVHAYGMHEAIERLSLLAQLAYRSGLDEEWLLSLGTSDGADWVGSTLDAGLEPYRQRRHQQVSLRLAWHNHYATGAQWSLEYSRLQRRKREAGVLSLSGLSTPVHDDLTASRDALELQHIHAWSEDLKTVWGLAIRQDRAQSQRWFHDLDTVGSTAWQTFANVDWRIRPDMLLHLGGTLEQAKRQELLLSPRLALNWTFRPGAALRMSVGHGYRTPTLLEQHAREMQRYLGVLPALQGKVIDIGLWAHDPLKPERTQFAELGHVALYPESNLRVDARVFVQRHERYIDNRSCRVGLDCPFPPPPDYGRPLGSEKAFVLYNAGDIRSKGGDLSLEWRHAHLGRLLLSHAYTRIHAGAGTDRDTEQTAPRRASSLLWSMPLPQGLQFNLGYYRLGHMRWLNDGDKQPAYTRVDVKLAKRLGGSGSEDEIALTLQNATGEHLEFRDEHTVQRQVFVTLRLSW